MLEISSYNTIRNKLKSRSTEKYDDGNGERASADNVDILFIILYMVLFVYALIMASKAKNKPLHMLFALISPLAYILFSNLVPGFND